MEYIYMVPNHNKKTLYCKIKTLQSRENASNQMAVWTKKLPFNRKKRERQEGAAIYHNYLEAFVYFFFVLFDPGPYLNNICPHHSFQATL